MAMIQLRKLWTAPDVNPINNKAKWVPILNPFCIHGRVFFFSWLGFQVAFLSWYAFPPLTPKTLATDLHLTTNDIANGNIVALAATLFVRIIIGPLCDRFGPRKCMAGCLLLGAIPSALAGTATNAAGLITIRFFVGILGATFVPCQVWCTGFFDKNCVGRANGLAAGWGNAGGGITYFVMPAVFDSLVRRGLTPHIAWRVSFVTVPFVIVVAMAFIILFLCPDTPMGSWNGNHLNMNLVEAMKVPSEANTTELKKDKDESASAKLSNLDNIENADATHQYDKGDLEFAEASTIQKPKVTDILKVLCSLPTITQCTMYFVTFGIELSINSSLSSFYIQASGEPAWSQTSAANWAAMYGLLNVVARPLGGYISDCLYPIAGGLVQGILLIIIGFVTDINIYSFIAAMAVSAMFTEAGNGANFAVIPHIHPESNGIVSGFTGASGNLGGIVFAVIFRVYGTNFHKSYWIIGIISIALSLSVSWIRVPKLPGEVGWLGKPRPGHL